MLKLLSRSLGPNLFLSSVGGSFCLTKHGSTTEFDFGNWGPPARWSIRILW